MSKVEDIESPSLLRSVAHVPANAVYGCSDQRTGTHLSVGQLAPELAPGFGTFDKIRAEQYRVGPRKTSELEGLRKWTTLTRPAEQSC
jgi:hypothetical protein